MYKNSDLKITNEKWYKDYSLGQITIKDKIYTLMITENKRKAINNYNNNKFIDTQPFIIKNGEIINNKE